LGWVEDFEQLGNRGNALDEYDRRFFEEYFLPLFSEGSVSLAPEWKHNAPAAYEDVDDSGAGTSLSVETCLSLFATP
jgi:hypothetical protein